MPKCYDTTIGGVLGFLLCLGLLIGVSVACDCIRRKRTFKGDLCLLDILCCYSMMMHIYDRLKHNVHCTSLETMPQRSGLVHTVCEAFMLSSAFPQNVGIWILLCTYIVNCFNYCRTLLVQVKFKPSHTSFYSFTS